MTRDGLYLEQSKVPTTGLPRKSPVTLCFFALAVSLPVVSTLTRTPKVFRCKHTCLHTHKSFLSHLLCVSVCKIFLLTLYPMYYCAMASESMSRLWSIISTEGKIKHNPNCPWNALKSSMSTHARFHVCNPIQKSSGTLKCKLSLFSCSVVSDSLWSHGLQHTRLPCPSPSPRVCSNSCPLNRWCHPTISFSAAPSVLPMNILMSFRIDWFDLLAVHRTLKSLLQHHSSKASILWGSGFFMVQLSHPYMTTGKTIALTRWTFVRPLS